MQKTTLAMVIIGVLLVLGGCNKAKEAAQEVAKAAKAEPKVLKVKDLYLGMNIDEVPAILKNLLPKHEVSQVKADKESGHKYVVQIDNDGVGGSVFAEADNKVVSMYFFGAVVNDLFNATDMTTHAFAEKFMSSYHLPSMNVSESIADWCVLRSGGKGCWVYSSPDGFKVSIGTNDYVKVVSIEKTTSESERKFD